MSAETPIFLFGAGGHGRAIAEVVLRAGVHRIEAVLDDHPSGRPPAGRTIIGGRERLASLAEDGLTQGFVAIGNNADRELVSLLVANAGLSLVSVIDPTAVISSDATIGTGTAMMPMSFAGAGAVIGDGTIVNTSATVDHDCVVEDYVHISVGAHLTGGCRVGARSFVGIGAVLGRPVTLGQRVMIGAGAAVITDIADGVVAGGVPARALSTSP